MADKYTAPATTGDTAPAVETPASTPEYCIHGYAVCVTTPAGNVAHDRAAMRYVDAWLTENNGTWSVHTSDTTRVVSELTAWEFKQAGMRVVESSDDTAPAVETPASLETTGYDPSELSPIERALVETYGATYNKTAVNVTPDSPTYLDYERPDASASDMCPVYSPQLKVSCGAPTYGKVNDNGAPRCSRHIWYNRDSSLEMIDTVEMEYTPDTALTAQTLASYIKRYYPEATRLDIEMLPNKHLNRSYAGVTRQGYRTDHDIYPPCVSREHQCIYEAIARVWYTDRYAADFGVTRCGEYHLWSD